MLPIKHILAAVDGSDLSKRALQIAASVAREQNADLTILQVAPLQVAMYGPASESYLDHLHEELCRLKWCPLPAKVHHLVLEGDPAAAIVQAAKDHHCDMIAMGSHGRTGLNRLLMGSVAERVMCMAPCPVLVVKAETVAPVAEQA
jgi:nucleotide-binding universal stress UspA family protein